MPLTTNPLRIILAFVLLSSTAWGADPPALKFSPAKPEPGVPVSVELNLTDATNVGWSISKDDLPLTSGTHFVVNPAKPSAVLLPQIERARYGFVVTYKVGNETRTHVAVTDFTAAKQSEVESQIAAAVEEAKFESATLTVESVFEYLQGNLKFDQDKEAFAKEIVTAFQAVDTATNDDMTVQEVIVVLVTETDKTLAAREASFLATAGLTAGSDEAKAEIETDLKPTLIWWTEARARLIDRLKQDAETGADARLLLRTVVTPAVDAIANKLDKPKTHQAAPLTNVNPDEQMDRLTQFVQAYSGQSASYQPSSRSARRKAATCWGLLLGY